MTGLEMERNVSHTRGKSKVNGREEDFDLGGVETGIGSSGWKEEELLFGVNARGEVFHELSDPMRLNVVGGCVQLDRECVVLEISDGRACTELVSNQHFRVGDSSLVEKKSTCKYS